MESHPNVLLLQGLHQLRSELVVRILHLIITLRQLLTRMSHSLLGWVCSSLRVIRTTGPLDQLAVTLARLRTRVLGTRRGLRVLFAPIGLGLRRHASIRIPPVLGLLRLLFLSRRLQNFLLNFFLLLLVDLFRFAELLLDGRYLF